MKYINLKTVCITVGLVIIFSYQPPIASYGKVTQSIKITVPRIDTVRFRMDSTLLDSLSTLKAKFEVSKIESKILLEEIEHQQFLLNKK